MCVGIGQAALKWDRQKKESSERDRKIRQTLNTLKSQTKVNYKIRLWSRAGIFYSDSEKNWTVKNAQFAWMAERPGKKPWPVFNVRVEGGFQNKNNDPNYAGPWGIFKNPYVSDFLKDQRCIVPCDFYIEQPHDAKGKIKFLVENKKKDTLFLAGVYRKVWSENNEESLAFTLLTTAYSPLHKKINHLRSPLILEPELLEEYLNPKTKGIDLISMFKPHSSKDMIAYQVNPDIAKSKMTWPEDDKNWIKPMGLVLEG